MFAVFPTLLSSIVATLSQAKANDLFRLYN